MPENTTKLAQSSAITTGVASLSTTHLLALYHAIHSASSTARNNVASDLINAVNTRVDELKNNKVEISTDDGNKSVDEFIAALNSIKNTDTAEYNSAVTAAWQQVDAVAKFADNSITWWRENSANAQASWQEAAQRLAKATNTKELTFEEAFTDLSIPLDGDVSEATKAKIEELTSRLQAIEDAAHATAIDSQEREDAVAAATILRDILNDVIMHSIGIDANERLSMAGFRDLDATTYRGGGTGGTVDELEGIGASNMGVGIGKGAYGRGTGTGYGDGTGSGSGTGNSEGGGGGGAESSTADAVNKDGSPISTAQIENTTNANEQASIFSYIQNIAGEQEINHIFHNNFYSNEPISHWAFSIDFIPASQLTQLSISDAYEYGRILTKAVISVKVPSRTITSTVSHYKGMSIELPARAKTSGILSMTFAENANFDTSTVLSQLFQFARSNSYFENNDYKIAQLYQKIKDPLELIKQEQMLQAYRHGLPKGAHLYNIAVKFYRMQDTKASDDIDNVTCPTYVYFFKGCDLSSVKQIELDYNNDKPVDVSCDWIYQYFEELTYNEYSKRYGVSLDEQVAAEEAALAEVTVSDEDMIAQADGADLWDLTTDLDKQDITPTEQTTTSLMSEALTSNNSRLQAMLDKAQQNALTGTTASDIAINTYNTKYGPNATAFNDYTSTTVSEGVSDLTTLTVPQTANGKPARGSRAISDLNNKLNTRSKTQQQMFTDQQNMFNATKDQTWWAANRTK